MSKLHKKMVALGDLAGRTYDQMAAACGPPRERAPARFTDIGEGTRATWSDGIFTITLNFDGDGRYCGIYHHRHWGPYLWLGAVTAVLAAAILIFGAYARRQAGKAGDAADLEALLLENESAWLHGDTAGICLLDLDFDGAPELLVTDTEIIWYDELDAYYFGDARVAVYSLAAESLTPVGGYVTDEYCFLATLHRFTDKNGVRGWYYASGGEVWLLSLENGALAVSKAVTMPDLSGGDEAMPLIRNESWVSALGEVPDPARVAEDVAAVAEAYFAGG